ncbi:MAG: winged helix-turn-helix transcriptional regulator [Deltaproteobacteria bacterium]|nr:winged helix-turn-helix transcriptional regulator [Deltaproteobacteria bacterium]
MRFNRPAVDLPLKAKLFRGLADPSRLAVLDVLRDGPRCVTEIAEATGLSQPNTSLHLACLEDCGLVKKERRGKFVYYQIAHKEAIVVLNQAEAILGKVGHHIFRCTRYEGGKNAKRR